MVTSSKRSKTKKGDTMCFAQCQDKSGEIEIIVFPNLYSNYSMYLGDSSVIFVSGKLSLRDDEPPKIIAEVIENADHMLQSCLKRDICIRLLSTDSEKIELVKNIVTRYSTEKGSAVKIYFSDKKVMTALKSVRFIELNEKVLKELSDAVGADELRSM